MAISMSNATIEDSKRTTFNSTEVDNSRFGGNIALDAAWGFASLAGITEDFATSVSKEIHSYIDAIKNKIEQMGDASSRQAFQGAGVTKAIEKFVEDITFCATRYCNALSNAEREIINSVEKAYNVQDSDLSSDVKSDSSTVSGFAPAGSATDTLTSSMN